MIQKQTEILFCTDGIFPHAVGGMQRHSLLLIEKLAAFDDLKITVVHPHEGIRVFNDSRISEIAIPKEASSGRYLIDCYRYSKKVFDIATLHPVAVIYSQGLSVWYGISKLKNRVIVNPHGLESYQTLSLRDYVIGIPFRTIFNHLFRNSVKTVSLGGRLTGILKKVVSDKIITVLPNAVNVPSAVNRSFGKSPLRFLFVGRFALNKGINVLAEAVRELNAEGYSDQFEFDLVGKGPLFEEYLQKYSFSNLHFLGFADDDKLNELYRNDDVFVLPTLFEGMPTVVLEAMVHGMPIIVTDVGATLEMVDATNGFIIKKNDVQSLKGAILNYLNRTVDERKSLSLSSYKKVKDNFTWDIVAASHVRLFRQIGATLK